MLDKGTIIVAGSARCGSTLGSQLLPRLLEVAKTGKMGA